MPPTKNGVFRQDITESPWQLEVSAAGHKVRFWFASFKHYSKFEEMWRSKAQSLTNTVKSRTGFEVDMTMPALFKLYEQVETFGYYVEVDGEPLWQRANLEFVGPVPRMRACEVPSSPSTPHYPTRSA